VNVNAHNATRSPPNGECISGFRWATAPRMVAWFTAARKLWAACHATKSPAPVGTPAQRPPAQFDATLSVNARRRIEQSYQFRSGSHRTDSIKLFSFRNLD